jgi:DNA-binding transcriptional ArsR family regulator|tara:strand:- start:1010 stop:1432 length:423 start_codon:yes stop_codon:yes gene_type:complete
MEYKIPESIQIKKIRDKDHRHFVVLPYKAIIDKRVTAANIRALAILAAYCNKQGFSIVGLRTLAKKLETSYQNVFNHLKKLEELGYVESRKKSAFPGIRGNLRRIIYDNVVKWDDVKSYMLDNEDINHILHVNKIDNYED